MLETYVALLTNSARNFKKNIWDSPILYLIFVIMILFSITMISMITVFFVRSGISIDYKDIFFTFFFLFMIKSSVDFYNNYTKSKPLVYALSTPVKHKNTIFEVFLYVFWMQMGIWILFSTFYNILVMTFGLKLGYPIEYIQIIFGIMLSTILGVIITLQLFSNRKYLLIPLPIIMSVLWLDNNLYTVITVLILSFIYLMVCFNYALDSYQFFKRKERQKEKYQNWSKGIIKSIFLKEVTILWREKLLISIVITSSFLGLFSGYLAVYGNNSFLPENLKALISFFPAKIYSLFGIYIMTIYASVFITLNFFLSEENTLWILRNLPVKSRTIVLGKATTLVIPFICCIPFIAFFTAFTGIKSLVFILWFLIFSFLAGAIVSIPLGAKYVGKKSDILLLYSVSIMLLTIQAIAYSLSTLINNHSYFFIMIVAEIFLLIFSIELSSYKLDLRYL